MPFGGNTMTSAVDLSAKYGYWAKLSGANVTLASTRDGIGLITDGGGASGDQVGVAAPGEEADALCGGTVAVDDPVNSDAAGKTQTCTSTQVAAGRALTPGSDGEWIRVKVLNPFTV